MTYGHCKGVIWIWWKAARVCQVQGSVWSKHGLSLLGPPSNLELDSRFSSGLMPNFGLDLSPVHKSSGPNLGSELDCSITMCAIWHNRSHVKILCFHCGYVWLICVYVYVCAAMCRVTELCENSMFSLWLFPAYVCVCLLLCFLFQLGQASFKVLINCRYFWINWMCCITVDKSVCEEDRSDDEEESKDQKDSICQLLNPKDGVSVQRQVLHALALDVWLLYSLWRLLQMFSIGVCKTR